MTKKEDVKDIATSTDLEAPSFIPQDTRGTENLDVKNDVTMPRLAIAQALSPELKSADPKFVEGLKQGEFFNSVSGKIYGPGPLEFTVILAMGARGVQFKPRSEGGGVIDLNVPLDDARMQFTRDAAGKTVKPQATKFYEFVIYLFGKDPELLALSLKSSGLKVAKILNSHIVAKKRPSFSGRYSVTVVDAPSAKGSYFAYQLRNLGFIKDEGVYKTAESYYDVFKSKKIKVDVVDEPELDPDDPNAEREM